MVKYITICIDNYDYNDDDDNDDNDNNDDYYDGNDDNYNDYYGDDTYILHFSVFGLRTVLIKQSAVHVYLQLIFHIK